MTVTTPKQFVAAYSKYGSIKAVARESGQSFRQTRKLYLQAVEDNLMDPVRVGRKSNDHLKQPRLKESDLTGRMRIRARRQLTLPPEGEVKRYIFTCAQNNTRVCGPFWDNLMALADHYDADVHVSRFLYLKSGLGATGDKTKFLARRDVYGDDGRTYWWDEKVIPYLSDEQAQIAPGLVWAGEANTLPTAKRPLSSVAAYTRMDSGIFPHAKIAMESVPTGQNEPTKFNYTTGACTLRNYIQRRAGIEAEFHHVYGALLVEVEPDGTWFARQLNADSSGTICDLDLEVKKGKVTAGHRVEAITWGDVHYTQIEPAMLELCWERQGSVIDILRPRKQYLHDTLDFEAGNPHTAADYNANLRRYIGGHHCARSEVEVTCDFVASASRPWCQTMVVASNHDDFLRRWLKSADYKMDPVNAEFFLECQLEVTRAIVRKQSFCVFEWLARQRWKSHDYPRKAHKVKFLREDEMSLVKGIECGMHGHRGPNGSRGSAQGFARSGRKCNVGHTHSAGIYDGVYTAGTTSRLYLGYNRGPSSWSHSFVLVYKNGKRAIITVRKGEAWAPRELN